jgi:hypothetical protein
LPDAARLAAPVSIFTDRSIPPEHDEVTMSQHAHSASLMPALAEPPSNRQRTFLRYYTGTLIDLVVLGLFDEFSDNVWVHSFSIALLAAIVLQALLKLTIGIEHWVLGFISSDGWMKFVKLFIAWIILFGSKFVILEALSLAFGDKVRFEGMFHGIVWLIIVVVVMLAAEEAVVRFYRRLA